MLFNELAAEIESQACSTDSTGAGIVGALKATKDPRLLRGWNADTIISDAQVCRLRFALFTDGAFNGPLSRTYPCMDKP
jgi:hypothetical protein